VSHTRGTVKDIPGLDEIRELSSFRRVDLMTQPGDMLLPTTNRCTTVGSVTLVSDSVDTLMADYKRIRDIEIAGLFAYTIK
jgi:L-amino acid ligase C-terminal domain 2